VMMDCSVQWFRSVSWSAAVKPGGTQWSPMVFDFDSEWLLVCALGVGLDILDYDALCLSIWPVTVL
jgi:hypothetical protein